MILNLLALKVGVACGSALTISFGGEFTPDASRRKVDSTPEKKFRGSLDQYFSDKASQVAFSCHACHSCQFCECFGSAGLVMLVTVARLRSNRYQSWLQAPTEAAETEKGARTPRGSQWAARRQTGTSTRPSMSRIRRTSRSRSPRSRRIPTPRRVIRIRRIWTA